MREIMMLDIAGYRWISLDIVGYRWRALVTGGKVAPSVVSQREWAYNIVMLDIVGNQIIYFQACTTSADEQTYKTNLSPAMQIVGSSCEYGGHTKSNSCWFAFLWREN